MTFYKKTLQALLIAASVFALVACEDGPAEEAGESVDEMVSDTGDAFEDAGESMDDAADDAGNAVEDACEDVKEGMNAEDKDC